MIIEIIKHTPKWVFGLLAFLVVLGVQQSRDRAIRRMLILPLPLGMLALSFIGVQSSFGLNLSTVALWLVGVVVFTGFFVKYCPVKGIQYEPEIQRLFVPGSWWPMVFILAIFFTKYLVGVFSALMPQLVAAPLFMVGCSLVYGGLSGIFFARALNMWAAAK